jgi:hypothetical protein
MDLMDLKPTSNTVEVNLKHPNTGVVLKNEDKTDMTIVVYATHSKEYKELMHEQTNKRLKAMQSNKKTDITAQDMEKATLDMLSKITSEWNITYNKEQPKLSLRLEIFTMKCFGLRIRLRRHLQTLWILRKPN